VYDKDSHYYRDQIEHFEQDTTTLSQRMKQQLVIGKSKLCAFNETLTEVDYNEKKAREEISQLQTYVSTFGPQIENVTYLTSH
jgi:hypothetical protein